MATKLKRYFPIEIDKYDNGDRCVGISIRKIGYLKGIYLRLHLFKYLIDIPLFRYGKKD